MKKIIFFLGILILGFVGCHQTKVNDRNITVSIAPIKWVVDQISDSLVNVNVLVDKNSSPENFDPSVGQISELASSDIYFTIGLLDFEKGLKDNIADFDVSVINLSDCVDTLGNDPHIWLSVRNMRKIAKCIHDELVVRYPDCAGIFTSNYRIMDSTLNVMDIAFENRIKANQSVLIMHPSIGYIARDYRFCQIPVEFEGKEPTASYIKYIYDKIKNDGIKYILYSVKDNPSEAFVIADETKIDAIEFDPLSENWSDELLKLVDIICAKQ